MPPKTKKSRKASGVPTLEHAVSSMRAFMRRYLPHLCKLPYAPMHGEWDDLAGGERQFLNLQAHREAAKSQFWAISYPLYRICMWLLLRKMGQPNEDEHGAILGVNDTEAQARLRQVRYELEYNALIKKDFNPRKGPIWTDEAFVLAGVQDVKNPTLQASGLTSFIPGPRLTFAILDDTTNKFHVESRAMRDKQHGALLEVVEPMMKDGGVVVCIHTTYHNDDLPSRLAKDGRYYSRKWPLVIDEDRKQVQWPEAWPWRRVIEVKKKPLVFARQYQLREVLAEERLIPMPEFYNWTTLEWRSGQYMIAGYPVRIGTGVDPATSERQLTRGSRTAIITGAIFPNLDCYVVDARGGRWPVDRVFSEIIAVHQQWHPLTVWIEAVNFSGIFAKLLSKNTGVPARPSDAKGDKQARLTGTLNPPMANHKIKFPDNYADLGRADNMDEMVREVIEFPGETMDFIDGFEHLYRNANKSPAYAAPTSDVIRSARRILRPKGWIQTKWD